MRVVVVGQTLAPASDSEWQVKTTLAEFTKKAGENESPAILSFGSRRAARTGTGRHEKF